MREVLAARKAMKESVLGIVERERDYGVAFASGNVTACDQFTVDVSDTISQL